MGAGACSPQPEGVDDDQTGVLLNYVAGVVLFSLAVKLYIMKVSIHGVVCEAGMSVGYIFGGLCHGSFANRAHNDNCANTYFYPFFVASYDSMIVSSLAWLTFAAPEMKAKKWTQNALYLSAALITSGGTMCQFTVDLFPGTKDDCESADGGAVCDRFMMTGEGIFYLAWIATWAVVARSLHVEKLTTFREKFYNFMSAFVLILGPGQIVLVSLLPVIIALLKGRSTEDGMKVSMSLYCDLRTGVTYILAVLASHLFTARVSSVMFKWGESVEKSAVELTRYEKVVDGDDEGEDDEGEDKDGEEVAFGVGEEFDV